MARLLLSPSVAFFELGDEDGLVYAEEIYSGHAYAHIIIFHRRALPDLDDQLQGLVRYAFTHIPSLQYISAWIPSFNAGGRSLMGRLNWTLDGLIRGIMQFGGVRTDALVYSISREEALDGR